MSSWKQNAEVFRRMPRISLAILLGAVLCLFSGMGASNELFGLENYDSKHFLFAVIGSGIFAPFYAYCAFTRRLSMLAIIGVLQFLSFVLLGRYIPRHHGVLSPERIHFAANLHALVISVFVGLGYAFFIWFIRREGSRFFAAHTEIELAAGIQRDLVPPLSLTTAHFEAYGLSLPSGAIGGDLIDVVRSGDTDIAYLADVSGHGVRAGVLMSMIKAGARAHCSASPAADQGFLESMNGLLLPLVDSASYATFAFVAIPAGSSSVRFSLAGHLPILHLKYAEARIERCVVENFPVAMFPSATFELATIDVHPGDLLAIYTDGLTELSNKKGIEIGTAYIEEILLARVADPLPAIANAIVERSARFAVPSDDRTLLLLRFS